MELPRQLTYKQIALEQLVAMLWAEHIKRHHPGDPLAAVDAYGEAAAAQVEPLLEDKETRDGAHAVLQFQDQVWTAVSARLSEALPDG